MPDIAGYFEKIEQKIILEIDETIVHVKVSDLIDKKKQKSYFNIKFCNMNSVAIQF